MDRREDNTPLNVAFAAIGVSIVAHLVLWPISEMLELRVGGRGIPSTSGVIEVSLLDDRDKSHKPEDEDLNKQLVNLDYLDKEERPDDAKYVSEFDHNPDREYRAPKNRRGRVSGGDDLNADPSPKQKTSPSAEKRSAVALPLGGRDNAAGEEGSANKGRDDASDDHTDGTAPKRANLSPRGAQGLPSKLRKDWGAPGTHDALDDDLEVGPGNVLKTQKYRYASFFNRVRNSVAQHWHPEIVDAANDPDGRKTGSKNRVTVLHITLNGDGSLKKVRLQRSSNVDYLDAEAIRAVRTAAPFTNPPPTMVEEGGGRVDFDFGFILDKSGRRRIFRYRK